MSCLFDVGVHDQDQGNEFVNDWCRVEWLVRGVSLRNLRLSWKETINLVRDDALVKEGLGLCHRLSRQITPSALATENVMKLLTLSRTSRVPGVYVSDNMGGLCDMAAETITRCCGA